jgi:hypothetical protein
MYCMLLDTWRWIPLELQFRVARIQNIEFLRFRCFRKCAFAGTIAHKSIVTTFVRNLHTCHCLAVVTRLFLRTKTNRKHGTQGRYHLGTRKIWDYEDWGATNGGRLNSAYFRAI